MISLGYPFLWCPYCGNRSVRLIRPPHPVRRRGKPISPDAVKRAMSPFKCLARGCGIRMRKTSIPGHAEEVLYSTQPLALH